MPSYLFWCKRILQLRRCFDRLFSPWLCNCKDPVCQYWINELRFCWAASAVDMPETFLSTCKWFSERISLPQTKILYMVYGEKNLSTEIKRRCCLDYDEGPLKPHFMHISHCTSSMQGYVWKQTYIRRISWIHILPAWCDERKQYQPKFLFPSVSNWNLEGSERKWSTKDAPPHFLFPPFHWH